MLAFLALLVEGFYHRDDPPNVFVCCRVPRPLDRERPELFEDRLQEAGGVIDVRIGILLARVSEFFGFSCEG